jgi:predicted nuclease of predicted toxin-antitoxin system
MRFLIDAQLPPGLARWLVGQGHTAEHVFDLGLGRASDRTVWARAITDPAVIITKDEDFVVQQQMEPEGPAVVWVRFGNTSRKDIIARFGVDLPRIIDALERGERLIELD